MRSVSRSAWKRAMCGAVSSSSVPPAAARFVMIRSSTSVMFITQVTL